MAGEFIAIICELRRLAAGGRPEFEGYGICKNLYLVCGVTYRRISDTFEAMGLPRVYPVCEVDGVDSPECQYARQAEQLTLWIGKHGELRRELCAQMADYLENHRD